MNKLIKLTFITHMKCLWHTKPKFDEIFDHLTLNTHYPN